ADAGAGGARTRTVRRDRDTGRPLHHAEHYRTAPDLEPVPGVSLSGVLDLALGADRGISRGAAADRVLCGAGARLAARGDEFARIRPGECPIQNGTFTTGGRFRRIAKGNCAWPPYLLR